MQLQINGKGISQPPLYVPYHNELHVAISSLSLGGAERIVLDWAGRVSPRWRVHLIIIKDQEKEWPVPEGIRVTRLHGVDVVRNLEQLGSEIASSQHPVCLCHLFSKTWRDALAKFGATIIPVLHNAKDGWPEDPSNLVTSPYTITVSDSSLAELRECGHEGHVSVFRHIPSFTKQRSRESCRTDWKIPQDAFVVGMLGAVKEQKNYPFALRVLREILRTHEVYLVILGGPVNTKEGKPRWASLVRDVYDLGIRDYVALPGYVAHGAGCLSAFDVFLNTSHFEGMSIATLEALMAGLPVVASAVDGQGEVMADGLKLVPADAPVETWAETVITHGSEDPALPEWIDFPSFRLWTLASIAHDARCAPSEVLFVSANLNSGGAQRSLVNLVSELNDEVPIHLMVTDMSSVPYFYSQLRKKGIEVTLTAQDWCAFESAESIVDRICREGTQTVCFWNVNAKVRLLVVKTLEFTKVRFVDVSPGGNSFEEMENTPEFQQLIAFTEANYNRRVNTFVLKYDGVPRAGCEGKTSVIPNGIPLPRNIKIDYAIRGNPRIVVSGRLAPAKFILEIIAAVREVWVSLPNAELHFYGMAEDEHAEYAEQIRIAAEIDVGTRIFFHGLEFEAVEVLAQYDLYVVLGRNQGCPNALLEALAVGLPSIANDDGGTREQVIHGKTGILLPSIDSSEMAKAMLFLLNDRSVAERLGKAGRSLVRQKFSMSDMVRKYSTVLDCEPVTVTQVSSVGQGPQQAISWQVSTI